MNDILTNQPYFYLKISGAGCRYRVLINDIEIHRENSSLGEMAFEFPANPYMRSGHNSFGIKPYPSKKNEPFNPHARISVELWVRAHDAEKITEGYKITDIQFSSTDVASEFGCAGSALSGKVNTQNAFAYDDEGDAEIFPLQFAEIIYPGAFKVIRTIQLNNSLPSWAFFESKELPDYRAKGEEPYYEYRTSIFNEIYGKVQRLLEEENVEEILTMCKERNHELDQAFYEEAGTYENRFRHALHETFNRARFELNPLRDKMLIIMREAAGKLVTCVRSDGGSAVSYGFVGCPGSMQYPITCREQDGKLIICR